MLWWEDGADGGRLALTNAACGRAAVVVDFYCPQAQLGGWCGENGNHPPSTHLPTKAANAARSLRGHACDIERACMHTHTLRYANRRVGRVARELYLVPTNEFHPSDLLHTDDNQPFVGHRRCLCGTRLGLGRVTQRLPWPHRSTPRAHLTLSRCVPLQYAGAVSPVLRAVRAGRVCAP